MANTNSRVLMTGSNQITQHYGNAGHGGRDLVKKTNQLDAITAHSDGTVVWCQSGIPNDQDSSGNRSYGNAVKLRHANGWCTLYAHMDYISVKNGQTVKKGQKLGYMGNTGNSYGAHLHFEVRDKSDARVNPEPYLNADLPGAETDEPAGYTGDLTYQAYTQKAWQPKVVNCGDGSDGYAGIYGSALQGLKIDAKNCDVYYRVHTPQSGWLPEVKNSGSGAWFTFWRPLHGKSPETARPFVSVQGAHDMYHAGEYMIFTDMEIYKCVRDTNFSPTDDPTAWKKI